jgi:uncharacterized RDD family membrane protein YckC
MNTIGLGRRGTGSRAASMSRRFVASLIDAFLVIGALIGLIAAAVGAVKMIGDRRPKLGFSRATRAQSNFAESRSMMLSLNAFSLALEVLTRNWRTPGSKITGIRLADADTGEPVNMHQAIIRAAVRMAWRLLTRRLAAPLKQPVHPQSEDLQAGMEALRSEHEGDPEGLNQALMAYHREHAVRVSCLKTLAPVLIRLPLGALIDAPALFSPMNQGLADMLAGTAIIVDR